MAITTGDLITRAEPRGAARRAVAERRVRREPDLPRLPLRLAARRRVLRARARRCRRAATPRARSTAGCGRRSRRIARWPRRRSHASRAARRHRPTAMLPGALHAGRRARAARATNRGRTSRSTATACGSGRSSSTSPGSGSPTEQARTVELVARYLAGDLAAQVLQLLGGVRRPASTPRRSPPAFAGLRRRGAAARRRSRWRDEAERSPRRAPRTAT